MKWSNGTSYRPALLLAFLFAGSLSCFPQTVALPQPSQQRMQSISQLKNNLVQALNLCVTLQQDLQVRIVAYQDLQQSYNELVQTQQQLQQQIASLQQNLSDSEKQLQMAQQDLQAMKDLSARLQTSLGEASKSLADYKSENDKAVKALEVQRDGWKYMAIGGAALGVAGVLYGLLK
jgi:chromosome segregation ATPase